MHQMPRKNFLENFSPKANFMLGVLSTVFVAVVVGFFILLYIVLKGGIVTTATTQKAAVANTNAAANTNKAPAIAVDSSKVKTDGEPFIGKADAPLIIAYWTDYQCPFCQRNEQQAMPQMIKDYVDTGKAKLIFKDFAFLGADSNTIGQYSRAVWAAAPDKYYDWHKAMFDAQGTENTGWATKDKILTITKTVFDDATTSKIDGLVTSDGATYLTAMAADKAEGTSLGVNGTPAYVIGTQLVSGAQPYATVIKTAIDQELAK